MRLLDIFDSFFLLEALEGQKIQRGTFIKDKHGKNFKGLPDYDDIDSLIEKIGEVDPTRNGTYMQWIADRLFLNPNVNRTEDLDRLREDLQNFERVKARMTEKDINKYKTFQDLYNAIAPLLVPRQKTEKELEKEAEAAEAAAVKDQIIVVYNGPEGWIKIPKTERASKYIGKGTRWCTSSDRNNRYTHYSSTDNLFVILDKAVAARYKEDLKKWQENPTKDKQPTSAVHQLHINGGEYKDQADNEKGMQAVPEWARPHILKYYKDHNPNLTWKQIMVLSTFGDDNLAAGSVHEGFIDLYAMYNAIAANDYKKILYCAASLNTPEEPYNYETVPDIAEHIEQYKDNYMRDMLTDLRKSIASLNVDPQQSKANADAANVMLSQLESFGMPWPELRPIRDELTKLYSTLTPKLTPSV